MAIEQHKKFKSIIWNETKGKWEQRRKSNPKNEQCAALYCRGIRACWYTAKGKFTERSFCHKCYSRLWRINNPFKNLFYNLKCSASRRGIPIDLTYGQFLVFCMETDYAKRQARFNSSSLTFDRIDARLGYTFNNLRIIPMGENTAFANVRRRGDFQDPDPF